MGDDTTEYEVLASFADHWGAPGLVLRKRVGWDTGLDRTVDTMGKVYPEETERARP